MSEFSESYHLRSERAEDAVELLRRAKRKGYVYQPVNGWVTFLAEEGVFEPDERIVAAATHPLRIPINSDTYSENNRTAIRSIRTVVGAERRSARTLTGVSELGQGFPASFAPLFRSAATCL